MSTGDGHRDDLPFIMTELLGKPFASPILAGVELPTACQRLFVRHSPSLYAGFETERD